MVCSGPGWKGLAEFKKETFCSEWFLVRNPVEKEININTVPLVYFLSWLLPRGRMGRGEGAAVSLGMERINVGSLKDMRMGSHGTHAAPRKFP